MSLKYALYKNNLNSKTESYIAITQVETTATLDNLIADMTSRGSTATRAEALSIWEELTLAVKNRLAKGENISTSLFYISQDIQGEFGSEDDSFRENRNTVVFNMLPGDEMKEVAAKVTVQKVDSSKPMPAIKDFADHGSATQRKGLTPGGTARITGFNLKIDTSDAEQGVFFVPADGSAEVKVVSYIDNRPAILTFVVPASLKKGSYKLEVRVKINRAKELRVTALTETLAAA